LSWVKHQPELIPDPLGDPSPSSNRKLLVGADIFNGSGIRKIQLQVEKFNLKLNKKKAASFKLQA